jgi:hypothetical protein
MASRLSCSAVKISRQERFQVIFGSRLPDWLYPGEPTVAKEALLPRMLYKGAPTITSLTLPVYRFLEKHIKQSTVPISFSFQPQGQSDIPLPSPLENRRRVYCALHMSFPSQRFVQPEDDSDASISLEVSHILSGTEGLADRNHNSTIRRSGCNRVPSHMCMTSGPILMQTYRAIIWGAAAMDTTFASTDVSYNPNNTVNTSPFASLPHSYSQWPVPFSPRQEDVPIIHHPSYTSMMPCQSSLVTQTRGTAILPRDASSQGREAMSRMQDGSYANQAKHLGSTEMTQKRPSATHSHERRNWRSPQTDWTAASYPPISSPTTEEVIFPPLSLVRTPHGSTYGSGILSTANPSVMSQQGTSSNGTDSGLADTQQKESTRTEEFKRNRGLVHDVNLEAIEPAKPGQFAQAGDAICGARVGMCALRSMEDRMFQHEEVRFAEWIINHAFESGEAEGLSFEQKLYRVKKTDVSPTDRPLRKVLPRSKETDRALIFRYLTAFRSYNDKIHGNGKCSPCIQLRPKLFPGFRCQSGTVLSDLEHILNQIFEILKYLLELNDVRDMGKLLDILTTLEPK